MTGGSRLGSTRLPSYVVERLRRPLPTGVPVIAGSTPVLSFGSSRTARVATLGLNPSLKEFSDDHGWLTGASRRLVELRTLGLDDLSSAPESLLQEVVDGCDSYFQRNPYWRWFRQLDDLLHPLGASYEDGTAAHLDLVQWATDPVWNHLPSPQRKALIQADTAFLHLQLQHEPFELVLMNGAAVLRQVDKHLARLTEVGSLTEGKVTARLVEGSAHGTRFLGWSCNLQSQPGITNALRQRLALTLQELCGTHGGRTRMTHIEKGTAVQGKGALAALLRDWVARTNEPTLGDVGQYGGTAWVYVELPGHTVVLNADTKREAVQEYLAAVEFGGQELPWHVVANRNGKVNKVLYDDAAPAPGWFCYTLAELAAPVVL